MSDAFVLYLSSAFTLAILLWAFLAYIDLWIFHTISRTRAVVSKILAEEHKAPVPTPGDYALTQGTYKNRRVVFRIARITPAPFLYYSLSLHCYIEPRISPNRKIAMRFPTPRTCLEEDNKIYYRYTSSTSQKTLPLISRIPPTEILDIFEELTRAAEIVESEDR